MPQSNYSLSYVSSSPINNPFNQSTRSPKSGDSRTKKVTMVHLFLARVKKKGSGSRDYGVDLVGSSTILDSSCLVSCVILIGQYNTRTLAKY